MLLGGLARFRLRAGAEAQVDAIKRLRALAKELGVTDEAPGPILGARITYRRRPRRYLP